MTAFEILVTAGILFTVAAFVHIVVNKPTIGSTFVAAIVCAGFAGFTTVTVMSEGFLPVWANHTANLWGVQVWWDLLISVSLALLLVVPRANKVGMNILPWALFVAATASIGLLAMVARLFWLERNQASS
ncbi:hypothetical protein P7228_11430 [Altererythrobacter arenosus]|uniref:DUF2834 domain-containing protein n=1 Tax=Altererythrobacter arenosus TaxID=3032592 RepID=A0ABY8FNK2_9SPHN|nr:hypothetical protein [Altererythrobacter sp. CAU 1644]WFL76605.1 hypothetical protein P7228_11430 [Altererythrobacter sp. CAU 1644]